MKKKLSLLLAIVMVLTLLPATVFAADNVAKGGITAQAFRQNDGKHLRDAEDDGGNVHVDKAPFIMLTVEKDAVITAEQLMFELALSGDLEWDLDFVSDEVEYTADEIFKADDNATLVSIERKSEKSVVATLSAATGTTITAGAVAYIPVIVKNAPDKDAVNKDDLKLTVTNLAGTKFSAELVFANDSSTSEKSPRASASLSSVDVRGEQYSFTLGELKINGEGSYFVGHGDTGTKLYRLELPKDFEWEDAKSKDNDSYSNYLNLVNKPVVLTPQQAITKYFQVKDKDHETAANKATYTNLDGHDTDKLFTEFVPTKEIGEDNIIYVEVTYKRVYENVGSAYLTLKNILKAYVPEDFNGEEIKISVKDVFAADKLTEKSLKAADVITKAVSFYLPEVKDAYEKGEVQEVIAGTWNVTDNKETTTGGLELRPFTLSEFYSEQWARGNFSIDVNDGVTILAAKVEQTNLSGDDDYGCFIVDADDKDNKWIKQGQTGSLDADNSDTVKVEETSLRFRNINLTEANKLASITVTLRVKVEATGKVEEVVVSTTAKNLQEDERDLTVAKVNQVAKVTVADKSEPAVGNETKSGYKAADIVITELTAGAIQSSKFYSAISEDDLEDDSDVISKEIKAEIKVEIAGPNSNFGKILFTKLPTVTVNEESGASVKALNYDNGVILLEVVKGSTDVPMVITLSGIEYGVAGGTIAGSYGVKVYGLPLDAANYNNNSNGAEYTVADYVKVVATAADLTKVESGVASVDYFGTFEDGFFNGEEIPNILRNGNRYYVGVRKLSNMLGIDNQYINYVNVDNGSDYVSIMFGANNENEARFYIGQTYYRIQTKLTDELFEKGEECAWLDYDTTYIPIRFVVEALGGLCEWVSGYTFDISMPVYE